MELKDDIKLNLYDEVIENTHNDDPAIATVDVFQRIQNNWLGEFRIPIRALLEQSRVRVSFRYSNSSFNCFFPPFHFSLKDNSSYLVLKL